MRHLNMHNRTLIFILHFFLYVMLPLDGNSQYIFDTDRNIEVLKNGNAMEFAFAGGLNTPMFSEIDLDRDGTLDLLLFDRVGRRILPMISKGINGTVDYQYTPQLVDHFPSMSDFLMTADFNCDGKMDLIVGGSNLKLHYNISHNAELEFDSGTILTFRSVGGTNDIRINPKRANVPGIFDVDNDGDLDLLFFGDSEQQISYMKNLSIERTGICGADFEWRSRCWGQFLESGINDSIYLDTCRFTFASEELTGKNDPIIQLKGNKHAGSTLTALDIDGNSSADLLIGDFGSERIKLLVNADSTFPHTSSKIFTADRFFPAYDKSVAGVIFPVAFVIDLDNDSKKDLVFTTNSTSIGEGVAGKNNIQFYKNSESSKYRLDKQEGFNYFFDNMLDFGRGANPLLIDIDKDGLLDLLVGNRGTLNANQNVLEGNIAYLRNIGSLTAPRFELIDSNYLDLPSFPLNLNTNEAAIQIRPTAGDIDGDGDMDLLIGDSEGRLHLFKDNNTSGTANFSLSEVNFQDIEQGTNLSPTLFDVNDDGLLDLVVGYTPGVLSYYQNYGSKTQPIYTIEINALISKGGKKLEIRLNNDAADQLDSGQVVRLIGAQRTGFGNGTKAIIETIDTVQNSIVAELEFNIDSTYNDTNSSAVLDPSFYDWGRIDYVKKGSNVRGISPHFYRQNGELNMILSTDFDSLHFYRDIDIRNDSFEIFDPLYTDLLYGLSLGVAIGDLNGDNKEDLIIGNESGGLRFHEALFGIGISENESPRYSSRILGLFPNPFNHSLTVLTNNNIPFNGLAIKDMQGKTCIRLNVQKTVKYTIDASELPTGLYFIEVYSVNGEMFIEKLIKTND